MEHECKARGVGVRVEHECKARGVGVRVEHGCKATGGLESAWSLPDVEGLSRPL